MSTSRRTSLATAVGPGRQQGGAGDGGHRVVHVLTQDEAARACPTCGVLSARVKQRVVTSPRNLCMGGEPITVLWHKRRWTCQEQLYPRGARNLPPSPQIPANGRRWHVGFTGQNVPTHRHHRRQEQRNQPGHQARSPLRVRLPRHD
ncbi:transposase family protein [Sphaerisporangium sp. NPDC049002]|uniref:transposase family protein n=1 Tax=Sphaerisporangium sp. NPDC049002 TaxID=3155392 RepID=UPI0033D0C860